MNRKSVHQKRKVENPGGGAHNLPREPSRRDPRERD